jgi:hypothetical protein
MEMEVVEVRQTACGKTASSESEKASMQLRMKVLNPESVLNLPSTFFQNPKRVLPSVANP